MQFTPYAKGSVSHLQAADAPSTALRQSTRPSRGRRQAGIEEVITTKRKRQAGLDDRSVLRAVGADGRTIEETPSEENLVRGQRQSNLLLPPKCNSSLIGSVYHHSENSILQIPPGAHEPFLLRGRSLPIQLGLLACLRQSALGEITRVSYCHL